MAKSRRSIVAPVAVRGAAVLIAALALAIAGLMLAPAANADAPAPAILTPSDGSSVPYGSPVQITGDNAVTGDLIEVFQGGNPACSFTAAADGPWSCVSSVPVLLGTTSIYAQQSDTTPSTTMGAETSFTAVPPASSSSWHPSRTIGPTTDRATRAGEWCSACSPRSHSAPTSG